MKRFMILFCTLCAIVVVFVTYTNSNKKDPLYEKVRTEFFNRYDDFEFIKDELYTVDNVMITMYNGNIKKEIPNYNYTNNDTMEEILKVLFSEFPKMSLHKRNPSSNILEIKFGFNKKDQEISIIYDYDNTILKSDEELKRLNLFKSLKNNWYIIVSKAHT